MDTNTGSARTSTLRRWLREPAFARRAHSSTADGALPSADRKLLEGIILPFYIAAPDVERILIMDAAHRGTTPRLATAKHVDYRDSAGNVSADENYDFILADNVFAPESSDPAECNDLLVTCFQWLRPGGHFVIGWNDLPDSLQVDALPALDYFLPYIFPPLHASRQLTDTFTRHTFQFFRKPAQLLDG
jgi:hypothetical protein